MKKALIIIATFCISVFAYAQEMQLPPLLEMKEVEFLLGNWKGDLTFCFMGQESKSTGTIKCTRALQDRYLHAMNSYEVTGMGKMEGLQLLSYDPEKKQFIGYWFDSSAPAAMELSGTKSGNVLQLISKPTKVPGMPGEPVFRATWTKSSDTAIEFALDLKNGDKWEKMIAGKYKKE